MQQALIRWLARHHRHILALAAIGSLASLAALVHPGLHEEYTVGSFVGSDSPEYELLEEFITTFGGSELTLIAVRGQDALDDRTAACLNTIIPKVEALAAVRHVSALTQLPELGRSLLVQHPLIEGVLVSHDRKTAAIVAHMNTTGEAGTLRKDTVRQLRHIVVGARSAFPDLEIILTGPYVTMLEMFDYVREDLRLFAVCIALLMLLTLYGVIGSWAVSIYAIGVAACAVLCTLGLTIAAGVDLSLSTQMIVIMLAVLSVATCVHLAVAYREIGAELPPGQGIARHGGQAAATLQRLSVPCSAMVLTSAAGFASLGICEILPIRNFGAVMVAGLVLALVLAFAGIFTLDERPLTWTDPRHRFHRWLAVRLERLVDFSLRCKRAVFAAFGGLAIILVIPLAGIRFESDFILNFRKNSSVRRGYEFVEKNLAPLGSIELMVRQRQKRSVINVHAMQACDTVARTALQSHPPVLKAMSVLDVLQLGQTELPSSEIGLRLRFAAARKLLDELVGEDVLSKFVTPDETCLRISLRAREGVDVWEKIDIGRQVQRSAQQAFGDDYEVVVTGLYYFYATLIAGMLRVQNITFITTLIAIFVMQGLVLRSWKLAAIGLAPSLFSMLASVGLMGWLKIPLNMATAMMLAISLGVAVDDTIQYLWRFRSELRQNPDVHAAILRSHHSVGQAWVFTTVVISGGFWILCASRFLPTAYFGALIGLNMIIVLAANLMLLPVLLTILHRAR